MKKMMQKMEEMEKCMAEMQGMMKEMKAMMAGEEKAGSMAERFYGKEMAHGEK